MNFDADAKEAVIARNHDHPGADAEHKQNVKRGPANAFPLRFASEEASEKTSTLIQPHRWILLTDRAGKASRIVVGNGFGKWWHEAGDANA